MCLAQAKIVHNLSVGDLGPHSYPSLLLGDNVPDLVSKLSRQYFTTIFHTSFYLPNDKIPSFKSVFIEILEKEVGNLKKMSRQYFR